VGTSIVEVACGESQLCGPDLGVGAELGIVHGGGPLHGWGQRARRGVEITAPDPDAGETAKLEVADNGTATVYTGSSAHGQGHHTAWAMLVQDELGIPMDQITVIHGDTDLIPTGVGTYGSRSLQLGGSAVHKAALEVKDEARHHAADMLEAAEADVVLTDRLAPRSLLDELPADVEVIDVSKIPYGRAMPQEQINATLIDRARAGRFVARLKGGDPFVFGRGAEEVLACLRAGVSVLAEKPPVISLREFGFFDSGSAALRVSALPALDRIASILAVRTCRLRIEGHTDNIPIHTVQMASNWELSTARATELVRLLIVRYRFSPDRLSAAGFAEYHPIASNDTEQGRAQNRRVDIVILSERIVRSEALSPSVANSTKPSAAVP
jgi:flagellar motor protein MotB